MRYFKKVHESPTIESELPVLRQNFRKALATVLLAFPTGCSASHMQNVPNHNEAKVHIQSASELSSPTYTPKKDVQETVNQSEKCAAHEKLPAENVTFLEAKDYYEGFAAVKDEKGWLYINRQGNPISNERYSYAGDFKEGLAIVGTSNDIYYIDTHGQRVEKTFPLSQDKRSHFEDRYDSVGEFNNGMAIARSGSYQFYITDDGTEAYPLDPRLIYMDYSEGFVVVKDRKDGRMQHLDKEGKNAYIGSFESASDFHEGLAAVSEREEWYHIETNGKPAYNKRFDYAGDFNEGLAEVHEDQFAFHIKPDGSRAYEKNFESVKAFREGLAVVMKEGRFFHVNKSGEPYPNRVTCTE